MAAVVLLAPLLLAGCASTRASTSPMSTSPMSTSRPVAITKQNRGFGDRAGPSDSTPVLYWTDASRTQASLTTLGGSSCPDVPARMRVASPTRVVLSMKVYTGACTLDIGPTTSVFAVPADVSRRLPVTFVLTTTDPEPDRTAILRVAVPRLSSAR